MKDGFSCWVRVLTRPDYPKGCVIASVHLAAQGTALPPTSPGAVRLDGPTFATRFFRARRRGAGVPTCITSSSWRWRSSPGRGESRGSAEQREIESGAANASDMAVERHDIRSRDEDGNLVIDPETPWYQSPFFRRVLTFVFPPLGLGLLWSNRNLSRWWKVFEGALILVYLIPYVAGLVLALDWLGILAVEWKGGFGPSVVLHKTKPNYLELELHRNAHQADSGNPALSLAPSSLDALSALRSAVLRSPHTASVKVRKTSAVRSGLSSLAESASLFSIMRSFSAEPNASLRAMFWIDWT